MILYIDTYLVLTCMCEGGYYYYEHAVPEKPSVGKSLYPIQKGKVNKTFSLKKF
jgi:hypothetical protein